MRDILQESNVVWVLTRRGNETSQIQCVEITSSPFRIGRQPGLALTLMSTTISNLHAEIISQDNSLFIRDLESKNGTYVNGTPVKGQQELRAGDLIQLSDCAFRLSERNRTGTCHTQSLSGTFDEAMAHVQFDKLMSEQAVMPLFHPIVSLPDKTTVGYEVFAGSRLAGLQKPEHMFLVASKLHLEEELSRMLRLAGFRKGAEIPQSPPIFLKTHPAEIVTFGLLQSLRELRDISPNQPVTLEVQEAAATDVGAMIELRHALKELDMQLGSQRICFWLLPNCTWRKN